MLHLVSPLSQGLFHKIIALSGSPSSPFLHNDRKPTSYARAFAKHVLKKKLLNWNCMDTISDDRLLEMMKTIPAKVIGENSILFKDWDVTNPCPWKPTIDVENQDQAFMPRPFAQAILEGHFDKNVKIIAGSDTNPKIKDSTAKLNNVKGSGDQSFFNTHQSGFFQIKSAIWMSRSDLPSLLLTLLYITMTYMYEWYIIMHSDS